MKGAFLAKTDTSSLGELVNPLVGFNKINVLGEEQIPGLKMTEVGLAPWMPRHSG